MAGFTLFEALVSVAVMSAIVAALGAVAGPAQGGEAVEEEGSFEAPTKKKAALPAASLVLNSVASMPRSQRSSAMRGSPRS
jgi:hypothetical protein